MLLALEWQWSKLRLIKSKNIKISNFELQKSFIPQKKAENMYNKDSARKNENLCKKRFFFKFFKIFSKYSRTPKNFDVQFFWNFEKKVSKIYFLGKVKQGKEQSHQFWCAQPCFFWNYKQMFGGVGQIDPPLP